MINYIVNKKSKLSKNKLKQRSLIIGNFDLIHLEHKKLFDLSNDYNILTFINIPKKQNNYNDFLQKYYMLQKLTNAHHIFCIDINKMNMSAQAFVDQYLKYTQEVITGTDFVFGSDQQPISHFANQLKWKSLNYNQIISTSKIKQLLQDGQIEQANKMLIRPFNVYSKVMHGQKLGRTIGFNTINFNLTNPKLIKHGVYLTKTYYKNKIYKSITMVGKPQTIKNQNEALMETYILEFNKMIYNKYVNVEFYKYLAPLKKFANKQALVDALNHYKKICINTNY